MLLLAKGTISQEDFISKLKLKKFFNIGCPKLAQPLMFVGIPSQCSNK